MISWIFIIIQLGFVLYLLYYLIAFVTGAPFVPSTNPAARRMIELANIKKGSVVYDLGSGDGRLLRLAAARGATAIGYEINPILVWWSRLLTVLSTNRQHIRIIAKSFWNADLKDADVIFVYLLPWRMERLEKKIRKECKKGTLIVSNSFMFPKLKLVAKDTERHIFVYKT